MNNKRELNYEPGLFDEEAALAALDGERELLSQLATMFVEDSHELLGTLDQAVAAENCRSAHHAIHSLKGQVATFFAAPVVELAQRLEHEAAEGRLTELTCGGCVQLRQSIGRLVQELRGRGLVE
ncbi:MAG: Hpt domain-containing protein [Planctomycetales bacterium]|nr:Hpt domain-containing protein [Planctomycetales bacterium]